MTIKSLSNRLVITGMVVLLIASFALGAKFDNNIRNLYHQFRVAMEMESRSMKPEDEQQTFQQHPSRPEHFDLPRKLVVSDHQAYLESLRLKYRHQLPVPVMLSIPAGEYVMGCQDIQWRCPAGVLPAHKVTLQAFEIAATETTFEQWDVCVAFGGCEILPGDFGWGRDDRPVINISWNHIQAYIKWLNENTEGGYRLPSEAEWEYAARGGLHGKKFAWGDEPQSCDKAKYGMQPYLRDFIPPDCPGSTSTAPVASYSANRWELYDVHGNVSEFTQDCANTNNYLGAPDDGSAWVDDGCDFRVQRGNSWVTPATSVMIHAARDYSVDTLYDRVGFRLARTL